MLVLVGLRVANLSVKQVFSNCLFLSVSFLLLGLPQPQGRIPAAQQIPALPVSGSCPSCSVSNLSAPNSGFSILLSVCDILIHCPHFLCYSFIFISISDKNITYSLSQFLHLVLCLFHTIVCIAFLPNYIKSSSELGCSFNTN